VGIGTPVFGQVPPNKMLKRSLTIAGHRTSIALEPEFWEGLEGLAARRSVRLTALIEEIDAARQTPNLSSALRVAVLRDVQDRLEHGTAS
jgi:predicted DNA-binding ribbon-helix-helix protein